MIDLHCHILPAVDDGSDSTETSCQMARLAQESCVDTIVATPHCNLPGNQPNYRNQDLSARFEAINRVFRREGIDVKILPGCEVFAQGNLQLLLRDRRLYTLNNSRYLLIEFRFGESPDFLNWALASVSQAGLTPVIAHPERYTCIQEDPILIANWFRRGCLVQLNKGSLLGNFGMGPQQAALWLLDQGLAHVIASDAHAAHYRTPHMGKILRFLSKKYPKEYVRMLLLDNPRRIINNEDIPLPDFRARE